MNAVSRNTQTDTMTQTGQPVVDIEQFSIGADSTPDSRPLHYSSYEEIAELNLFGGPNLGSVLFQFGVDYEHDNVTLEAERGSQLQVLARVIETAQRLHDALERMSPEAAQGQCMSVGGWGRCKSQTGHQSGHDYPTEADWEAQQVTRPRRLPRIA